MDCEKCLYKEDCWERFEYCPFSGEKLCKENLRVVRTLKAHYSDKVGYIVLLQVTKDENDLYSAIIRVRVEKFHEAIDILRNLKDVIF